MKWFLIFLLILVPFVYADTINIGGGGTQQCTGDFTSNPPTEWHYHLFPVPVMIDSRMGEQKVKMFIYAIAIWNKVYKSFLETHFREPQEYPQKLFAYRVVTSNYSNYEESPYIVWVSEKLLPIRKNGVTKYADKWYWVFHTIKGAYIHMNSRRRWYFEKNDPLNSNWNWPTYVDRNKIDFLTIALHELGHAIGLEHVRDSKNIMFPCTNRGKRVYPTYKDVDKFFKNHDYEIKLNLWPTLMGAE